MIATNVPVVAKILEKESAGIVIGYKRSDLYDAIKLLLTSKKDYVFHRNAAIKLLLKYDVENILRKEIKNIP